MTTIDLTKNYLLVPNLVSIQYSSCINDGIYTSPPATVNNVKVWDTLKSIVEGKDSDLRHQEGSCSISTLELNGLVPKRSDQITVGTRLFTVESVDFNPDLQLYFVKMYLV